MWELTLSGVNVSKTHVFFIVNICNLQKNAVEYRKGVVSLGFRKVTNLHQLRILYTYILS